MHEEMAARSVTRLKISAVIILILITKKKLASRLHATRCVKIHEATITYSTTISAVAITVAFTNSLTGPLKTVLRERAIHVIQ